MISVREELVDSITGAFHHLLRGQAPAQIGIPADLPDNEIRQLIGYVNRFLAEYAPLSAAMHKIAEGDLESPTPPGKNSIAQSYKSLQSSLRHLTWKTQRIAEGGLDETVDFMGEFSAAFNSMTRQLKESFEAIEKRNRELETANRIIQEERDKSEKLLLNILPAKVADELKETGHSEPQSFEAVTVFFSDVVEFTRHSSGMAPRDLIDELNTIFTRFDEIMESHGCERIKSIGDAYLAVCGAPDPDPEHAQTMTRAAVEILDYMRARIRQRAGGWQIRIGLHSGRLVGGIVGIKKYIYDVFGDTINTASRMETCSEPMRINVSETTYHLLKGEFRFVERAPVEVKGKGAMKMFFVDV